MSKANGRPFQKGNKMGRGRPKGSRNKPTWQASMEEFAPSLIRKCIALALQGNSWAMRLCIERILPVRQDTPVHLNLPATGSARDVDKASNKLVRDVTRGRVTPGEGGKVMNILEARSRLIEKVQLESRLEALERKASEDERRTG